ncbi:hypothetical protein JS530_03325 [Bifidobacterium sp. LC6]|uniref:Uncharacterized protein n=1 Tax=Bifidobacterium colobi TaxID=2809026 RepID=A0ABS5UU07_9BIFI|nr:hypothetical protein [Bifidobacterium colobi]MBT1174549.1 hypothetical protein [Bifidobacterium colobi]
MGVQVDSTRSAEERLAEIACSTPWELPREVTRYRDALDEVVAEVTRIEGRLAEPGVFECGASGQASRYRQNIVKAIQESNVNQQINKIQERIGQYNAAIETARSVSLPGDALDEASCREIMKATDPMNLVVPGLGTVSGIAGIAGINLVNRMLATNRDEVAQKKLEEIQDSIDTSGFDGGAVPVVDPPAPEDEVVTGTDGRSDDGGWRSGVSAGVASAGVLAGAGAAALSRAGAGAAAGSSGGSGSTGVASAAGSSSGASSQYQRVPSGVGGSGVGSGSGANGSGSSGGGASSGGSAGRDGYYYDPVGKQWVRVDDGRVSVDSGSGGLAGGSSFGKTAAVAGAVGAGAGAGGAVVAGRLAGGSAAGAGLTAVSGAGGLAAVGGGAGVGSYYANAPVHAVPVSSSIKGATGMAAGLSSSSNGVSASSAAGARGGVPGMVGGQGGAGDGRKGKRRGLGYIAPVLEDDEGFEAKPLAAMAGHRKRANE